MDNHHKLIAELIAKIRRLRDENDSLRADADEAAEEASRAYEERRRVDQHAREVQRQAQEEKLHCQSREWQKNSIVRKIESARFSGDRFHEVEGLLRKLKNL